MTKKLVNGGLVFLFALFITSCSTLLDYRNAPITQLDEVGITFNPPSDGQESKTSTIGSILTIAKAVANMVGPPPITQEEVDDMSLWMDSMIKEKLVVELSVPLLPETTESSDFGIDPFDNSWEYTKNFETDSKANATFSYEVQLSYEKSELLSLGNSIAQIGVSQVRPTLTLVISMMGNNGRKTLWSDSVTVRSKTTQPLGSLGVFGITMGEGTGDDAVTKRSEEQEGYRKLFLEALQILINRVLAGK